MSTDTNSVVLVGRLVRDPEMRTTSAGQYVTRFGIANSRYVKDPQTGGWKQLTSFFNIIVWGDQALRCHNELRKGSQVAVSTATKGLHDEAAKAYIENAAKIKNVREFVI